MFSLGNRSTPRKVQQVPVFPRLREKPRHHQRRQFSHNRVILYLKHLISVYKKRSLMFNANQAVAKATPVGILEPRKRYGTHDYLNQLCAFKGDLAAIVLRKPPLSMDRLCRRLRQWPIRLVNFISFGLDLRVNACRILGNGSLTIRAVRQPSPAGEKYASRTSGSCCP